MAGSNQPTNEAFAATFEALQPLIRAEWPVVDEAALTETAGDYEKVVALVAKSTEHTKALVRRHLGELQQVAAEDAKGEAASDGTLAAAQRKLQETLKGLQAKASELSDYVRTQALADAKTKAEQHPLVTLLMAVGLGFILGFVLRGLGRGRQPPA
jgi:ElaB/YqjD/DUF883 family membrane-anchored ribosome-binding protein